MIRKDISLNVHVSRHGILWRSKKKTINVVPFIIHWTKETNKKVVSANSNQYGNVKEYRIKNKLTTENINSLFFCFFVLIQCDKMLSYAELKSQELSPHPCQNTLTISQRKYVIIQTAFLATIHESTKTRCIRLLFWAYSPKRKMLHFLCSETSVLKTYT